MIPLRIIETDREEFDGTVAELWREDEFVGMVFWDGERLIADFYPDEGEESVEIDVADLLRALDLAARMVAPYEDEEDDEYEYFDGDDDVEGWESEDPRVVELVTEFDPLAVHRSEGGRGFFLPDVAAEFVDTCERLGLAVLEVEGFGWDGEDVERRPEMLAIMAPSEGATQGWDEHRPAANLRAREVIAGWPNDGSVVVGFVVAEPGGESFVA
jgi:hypothetical protein